MRRKITLALAVVVGLVLAGAGYVAVRGLQVDPAPWNLSERWVTDDQLTWISLRQDGGFTAGGISKCIGQIDLFDPDTGRLDRVPDIASGDGTWRFSPSSAGGDGLLMMQFQKPAPLRLRWFVTGSVEWRFRPVAVTLGIVNQSGDADVRRCSLHT